MKDQVIIVGAGIAGLAAAIRLAAAGKQVQVFERAAGPGGKLSDFKLGDYRFDLGPSLFTMPQYVDELFRIAGEDPRAHFNYQRLETVCHYWWPDGTQLAAAADVDQLAENCATAFKVPAERIKTFMQRAEQKYELAGRTFLEKSLHQVDTWLQPSVAKAMFRIPGLDLFRSMHRVHERELGHPKLVQLFDRFATYNGSNPYKAPGLLSMIPHFEHHFGAYLPKGGMVEISQSLYRLGQGLGVSYHFNAEVAEIERTARRVTGVRLSDGSRYSAEQVVCNMDVFLAYDRLLSGAKQPKRTLRQQKSTSAIVFYWGVQRSFPELGLHNIIFSDDYQTEFAEMEAGRMSDDPTVYINVTSKLEAADAPTACENWFVMVNAPADTGQDWESLKRLTRQRVLDKLAPLGLAPTEKEIVEERILGPTEIERLTGSHQGALYGTSSNNKFAAFLRHPNFSRRIKGLYFLGGSVHPGGGIPLCLLSAKITGEIMVGSDNVRVPE